MKMLLLGSTVLLPKILSIKTFYLEQVEVLADSPLAARPLRDIHRHIHRDPAHQRAQRLACFVTRGYIMSSHPGTTLLSIQNIAS